MRWPWQRNQHAWDIPPWFINEGGWLYVCSRCGEKHYDNGYWEPFLPPEFGCTPLPIPASAPAISADSLPVAVDKCQES